MVHFDRSGYLDQSDWNDPFHNFAKIVVPSTTLLYPTYKNNNQMRSALGQVCATEMYWTSTGHMKFPKFQTRIFAELPAHYN